MVNRWSIWRSDWVLDIEQMCLAEPQMFQVATIFSVHWQVYRWQGSNSSVKMALECWGLDTFLFECQLQSLLTSWLHGGETGIVSKTSFINFCPDHCWNCCSTYAGLIGGAVTLTEKHRKQHWTCAVKQQIYLQMRALCVVWFTGFLFLVPVTEERQ